MTTRKFTLTEVATGKTSSLEAQSPTVGPDVLGIAPLAKDHGVFTFDPGFMSTAACESKITYIDGDKGVLLYRGYPVEQLAAKSCRSARCSAPCSRRGRWAVRWSLRAPSTVPTA